MPESAPSPRLGSLKSIVQNGQEFAQDTVESQNKVTAFERPQGQTNGRTADFADSTDIGKRGKAEERGKSAQKRAIGGKDELLAW
jgi:hypothetical protein